MPMQEHTERLQTLERAAFELHAVALSFPPGADRSFALSRVAALREEAREIRGQLGIQPSEPVRKLLPLPGGRSDLDR